MLAFFYIFLYSSPNLELDRDSLKKWQGLSRRIAHTVQPASTQRERSRCLFWNDFSPELQTTTADKSCPNGKLAQCSAVWHRQIASGGGPPIDIRLFTFCVSLPFYVLKCIALLDLPPPGYVPLCAWCPVEATVTWFDAVDPAVCKWPVLVAMWFRPSPPPRRLLLWTLPRVRVLLALSEEVRCWWDLFSEELTEALNRHRWQPFRTGGGRGAGAGGGDADRAGESGSEEGAWLMPSIVSSTCDSWFCCRRTSVEVDVDLVATWWWVAGGACWNGYGGSSGTCGGFHPAR